MSETLPASLANNRRPDRWLRFEPDRTVRLAVGKVEIGQGVVTALAQIAAEELDVALSRMRVLSGDTAEAPDEGSTTSSQSIEVSGASVRLVAAEVRQRIVDRLAQRLNCSPHEIAIEDGVFFRGDSPTGQDYWSFADEADLVREADGGARPKPATAYTVVGTSAPRLDLPGKLTGAAFIHDMVRAGMLHARILRQPGRGARLAQLDEDAIRRAARGAFELVRRSDFVAFVGEDETVVERAAQAAAAHATWTGARRFTALDQEAAPLVGRDAIERIVGEDPARLQGPGRIEATYSRPYVAHASIAPSCALAEYRAEHLTVWSHTQGVYPLRNALAAVLGLPRERITVRHVHGAGCYGHNGADDVALDAALIALGMPDCPIRVQWRRADEFAYEPFGTAMSVTLSARLDAAGKPLDWRAEIWAGTHVSRPATGGNLLAAEALDPPAPPPRPQDPPEANGGGGTRNAVPLYDIPAKSVLHHLVTEMPVRTSALRGLGALPNVFAIESFIDELAARAGDDPLTYRLAILSEPRARRVLEAAASLADYARGPAGTGRGLGIGFSRYKNRAAYCAVIAAVEVADAVHVRRVWCAVDAGLVINPDGARNQVEGGIVQAISMTLKEQVRLGPEGVASLDWESYPILRFSETPEISTELIAAPDQPTLGIGECAFGPTAAAIGNAVAHALGARIRDMPLSRERIAASLLRG
ncbi:MAG: xanthine dehydrogenase family protein molybdopterin-binding subunit [Acetobacteraceae bacterium]|nr:xanthine dehydrogenase family protein molybdopterin-binding subunit [Acetobacteraceae bacterium]